MQRRKDFDDDPSSIENIINFDILLCQTRKIYEDYLRQSLSRCKVNFVSLSLITKKKWSAHIKPPIDVLLVNNWSVCQEIP